ncbi:ATP-binding cassette domain-containing protein [Saccharopolyspora sp. NPDC050642]|uniref:ATP-binding cassette domain-containing protein n=1 Tax=Saccharopolyspora sp. NPDC050642 TaxID=3157099 RepID=UPI0033D414BF
MSALSTIGLFKRYGDRRGIEDCTVELPEGKVVALVGANGAGKSTFLALAAGLVEPSSGAVRVFGDEVRGRIHPDLVGPADAGPPEIGTVVHARKSGRQQRMLVRAPGVLAAGWESRQPDLESLVTDYLRAGRERAGV